MNPTNTSKKKNGTGTIIGIKNAIIISNTSPANIFPKSLNAKEIIFENSDIISRIPVKKLIGFEKLKNFFRYSNNPKFNIP